MSRHSVIGKSVPRVDTKVKATGVAKYTDDLEFPRMLYSKVLRSPYPHAKILSINTSKAERVKGVEAVIYRDNVPRVLFGDYIRDQSVVALDKVRYIGEPIAAVAAVDLDTAEEALSLIEVNYEELEPIFNPEKALEEKTNLIHEKLGNYEYPPVVPKPMGGTNICSHAQYNRGDVNQGFKEAYKVYEDRFTTQIVHHSYIEPHIFVAAVDPSDNITIHGTFQSPFDTKGELARIFQVPESKVRVIVPFVGGGFGGKSKTKVEPIAVSLAQKSGKPVKMTMSREEEFIGSVVRHPTITHIKTGVSRDGKLLARTVKIIYDTGAYGDDGPYVADYGAQCVAGPYQIPNVSIDGYSVYTNKPVAGAMRGFGNPQPTTAYESQMDTIAEDLGIDPLEIRLKNAVEEGSTQSATGEILHSVGLKETLKKATDNIEWGKERVPGRGIGIACTQHFMVAFLLSSALVRVNEDGKVEIFNGAQELGQGVSTILIQIASEIMDIPTDQISKAMVDTQITPYDFGAVGSRETFFSGNSVKLATEDAKRQLISLAAEKLGVSSDDLVCAKGRVFVKREPEKSSTFEELALYGRSSKKGPIIGKASFDQTASAGQSQFSTGWMYGTQVAEVEVDRETGEVKILKIVAAHDVGKAINPFNCEQQVEGALVTGLGFGLYEELTLDAGKAINASFVDYKIPRAQDIPEIIPIIVEAPHKEGPFGAKGLGEVPNIPTAAAISNAICNAVGVRIKDLPITPEKIVRALQEKDK